MKIFSLLILLVVISTGPRALGETPQEAAADHQLRIQDADAVAKIRTYLETTYLGGSGISAAQNEGMRKYIDWLMSPLETLTNEKGMTNNLRFKPIGGPSGSGKTKVSRDFAQKVIEAGLLDERRYFYQQGDEEQNIELSIIDRLALKDEDVKKDSGTSSYKDARARFYKTYAVVLFDEASLYAMPPKDFEVAYQNDLKALIEKSKAQVARAQQTQPLPPKPIAPAKDAPELAHLRHETALLEWELAASLQQHEKDEAMERAVARLKAKYERLREERKEVTRIMKMLWQAASGGKYVATEERKESEEQKAILRASDQAVTNFRARYINEPLLPSILDKLKEVDRTHMEIKIEQAAIDSLEGRADEMEKANRQYELEQTKEIAEERARSDKKISDFSGLDVRAIAGWMKEQKLLEQVAKQDGRIPTDPAFIARMIREITAKPNHYMTYQLGYRAPTPGDEAARRGGFSLFGSGNGDAPGYEELADKLRTLVLEQYKRAGDEVITGRKQSLLTEMSNRNAVLTRLKAEPARHQVRIAELEKEKAALLATIGEFGRTVKEQKGEERHITREGLIREYRELMDAHNAKIAAAALASPAARMEIDKFINALTPEILAKKYPAFHARLVALEHDVAKYLTTLKRSESIAIKLMQMMRMDAEGTRTLVFDAVINRGFQSEVINLGNVNVAMMMNYRPAEQEVAKYIEEARKRGETVSFDKLAELYHGLVPKDWAEHFFKDHFPTLFTDLLSKTNGNPQAAWRRLFGDTGPFFFYPLSSNQMLNAAETTMRAKFNAWQASHSHGDNDVKVELYIHENVPGIFVRDDQAAELGNNVALEQVREAMNGLLGKLNVQYMKKGPNGFHVKLALVNEGVKGGLQKLRLRYLPYDFTNEDALDGESYILKDTPRFGKNSLIGEWSHTFTPAKALSQPTVVGTVVVQGENGEGTQTVTVPPRKIEPVILSIDGKDGPQTKAEAEALRLAEERRRAEEAADLRRAEMDAVRDAKVEEEVIRQKAAAKIEAEKKAAEDAARQLREEQAEREEKARLEAARYQLLAQRQLEEEEAKARQGRWDAKIAGMSRFSRVCLKTYNGIRGRSTKVPPADFK